MVGLEGYYEWEVLVEVVDHSLASLVDARLLDLVWIVVILVVVGVEDLLVLNLVVEVVVVLLDLVDEEYVMLIVSVLLFHDLYLATNLGR